MSEPLFTSALLVEDEPHLATALKVALRKLDIAAEHALNLKEAKNRLFQSHPEFILLDRNLPDGDGITLCKELREKQYKGTILVLTAAGQIDARVEGLNAGADDYLPKPFSWEELEARIRALSRRKTAFRKESALWQREDSSLRILGPKGWVELTPLEYKLACQLIQKPGEIITRTELLKEVWGFHFLTQTRTVDHFLGRLRKHFESNPEEPRHFLTIRGAGYKFQS